MRKTIPLKKKSQFDPDIKPSYRNSACGPVTAYTILNYYFPNQYNSVNQLYKQLGGTPIGLFTHRFVRNLANILGDEWIVDICSLEEAKKQIDLGHPVAVKFDKWFSWKWRGRFSYDYHWVPLVGYEENDKGIQLLVHDNGGKNRASRLRSIPYELNKDIITFVKIDKRRGDDDESNP